MKEVRNIRGSTASSFLLTHAFAHNCRSLLDWKNEKMRWIWKSSRDGCTRFLIYYCSVPQLASEREKRTDLEMFSVAKSLVIYKVKKSTFFGNYVARSNPSRNIKKSAADFLIKNHHSITTSRPRTSEIRTRIPQCGWQTKSDAMIMWKEEEFSLIFHTARQGRKLRKCNQIAQKPITSSSPIQILRKVFLLLELWTFSNFQRQSALTDEIRTWQAGVSIDGHWRW